MASDYFEKRDSPRIPLNGEKALQVSQVIDIRLLDISLGGVRFRSTQRFVQGMRISIGNDLFSFGATILEVTDLSAQPEYDRNSDQWASHPYAIRCEYAHEEDQEDISVLMALVLEEEEEDGIVV
jgi:hypothetical protein